MSFWDNVKKFAQPYDDEDYDDYDEELDEYEEPAAEPAPRTRRPSPFGSSTTAAPAAAPVEMHETVKSIEETVNKVADVPEQTIIPDIVAPQPAFDAAPTRAFGVVSDATVQFSFDSFDDVD